MLLALRWDWIDLSRQVIWITAEFRRHGNKGVPPAVPLVRFCYDICAKGTLLEGSVLEIIEVAGAGVCRDCGGEVALSQLYGRCICGGANLRLVAGEELKIKEMEVA